MRTALDLYANLRPAVSAPVEVRSIELALRFIHSDRYFDLHSDFSHDPKGCQAGR